VGEAVVLVAEGGPPTVEFALFDAGDIELHSTQPGTIREIGYRTTVAEARTRLADARITPALAEEIAAALRPAIARSYARGAAARCVVDRLEAVELLESRRYDAATGAYLGTWLDLGALGTDLGLARGAQLLHAIYLAAYLANLPDDMHVFLATLEVSSARRPGERTFRRVTLEAPEALRKALATLQPRRTRSYEDPSDPGPSRLEVVNWLRERAAQVPSARERLRGLEATLAIREAPVRGPLAETALWNLEAKLSRGETAGVAEQIDALEQRRGRVPGTLYLRARLALMQRTEEPRPLAERVSELSTSMASFHELQLLAAQAWLAAADLRRARAFARDLLDNTAVDDVLRMQASEVLDAAGQSSSALASVPAPAPAAPVPVIQPQPVVAVSPPPPPPSSATTPTPVAGIPRARPATLEYDPHRAARSSDDALQDPRIPGAPLPPSGTGVLRSDPALAPRTSTRPGFPALPHRRSSAAMRTLPPGTSLPPYRIEPRGQRVWSSPPPPQDVEAEHAATLAFPAGTGPDPVVEDPPRSAPAARVLCTLLARELGRQLQERHGVELRTDLDGLELAQRFLRETLVDGRVRAPDEQREVMRQGGFLAELLARRLGARWVDLESPEPGRWAMLVPSRSRPDEVARVWPFARVLRFVAMGHKERDLVSYYLELEARSR
jgi:hypothetical protein